MRFLIAILLLLQALVASAENCDTDCHRQCRIRTDFPPIEFIEPTCHAKCEALKQAACRGLQTPTIPLTPREQFETGANFACAAPFKGITGSVIARCSNWDGRTENQDLIQNAVQWLLNAGQISPSDLNGVQVRWCPLNGAHGMAPDRGRIYLDTSLQMDTFATATTLAHEIFHIRQYRAAKPDQFECNYSRQFTECGGCQDRRHALERDAYNFEDSVRAALGGGSGGRGRGRGAGLPSVPPMPLQLPPPIPVRFCRTPFGTCNIPPTNVPMGTQCFCNGPNGQIWGSAF